MATGLQTRERTLNAAEALLRRHWPAKTAVVGRRALGMSHAADVLEVPADLVRLEDLLDLRDDVRQLDGELGVLIS